MNNDTNNKIRRCKHFDQIIHKFIVVVENTLFTKAISKNLVSQIFTNLFPW